MRYSINPNYRNDILSWYNNGKPKGETFELGSTGPVLQGLGAIESDIYMTGDKIRTILDQHKEMSIAEISRIPEILEDPVLILKSKGTGKNGDNSRMVVYGSIKAKNGQPILSVLDLRPRENGFLLNDMQKVNSAYTKNNPIGFISNSEVLYADKKRTIPLLRQFGLTITSRRLLQSGSIGSISYDGDIVNLSGEPFLSVVDTSSGNDTEFYDDQHKYSMKVTDKKTLDFLNNQKTITTYKTMQYVDGKLYPPMAARINGQYEDASTLGQWEQAVEHPEFIRDGNKFKLDKGKGQGSLTAAYNPYMHSSNLVINDQFTGAYTRDNLVTVECEVPVSEATSGYKADGAKDNVGWHAWHTGTVAGQIRKETGVERQVFLSRWIKPVRIIPDAEVAKMYKTLLKGTQIKVPDNVVTPSLLSELKKAGVPIEESGRIRYSLKNDSEGRKLSEQQEEYFKDSKVRDEDGNLLVVYHGTDADFTVFDRSKSRANMDIQGNFFSPWEIDAKGYGSNVSAYYLNITNPANEGTAYKALNRFKGQNEAGVKAREYLISLGYDGVNNSGEEYIAFYPEQIKRTDNSNPSSNPDIRYSLKQFDDGKRFVDVETDQAQFDGLSLREMGKQATRVIKERFAGKVIGIDNRTFVNGRSATEYGFPAKRLNSDTHEAKMRASTELDNLIDAGTNFRTEPDGRDGHVHQNAVGDFRYFDTIFKVGNEYYSGVINIEPIARGLLLKDVTKVENITQDIRSSYGTNPKSTFLRDVSMETVTQEKESVKGKKSKEEIPTEELLAELVKRYGAMPTGENPFRDIVLPKKTAKELKLSQTVRTILEAKATPEVMVPSIQELAADGTYSYQSYSDEAALSDAETKIRDVGWGKALEDWNKAVRNGEVSKANTAMGWALYDHAANSGDTATALMVLNNMVEHQRSAAQAVQATRILKQMNPETQLYGVQRSVANLQKEINERYGKKGVKLIINEDMAERFMKAETQTERDWHTFVQQEKEKDLSAIIAEEKLKPEEARRFLDNSFRDGTLKTTGTDLDRILPPVSRFGGGSRAEKKRGVIARLSGFFEKYLGVA